MNQKKGKILIVDDDKDILLREILKANPETQVIMITAYGEIETAVVAMKNGAISKFKYRRIRKKCNQRRREQT